MSQSVELPAMSGSGQLRLAKVPEGATVQLIKVDGDRVEVIYQGFTLRMPVAVTDLASRVRRPNPAPVPEPAAVVAPAPVQPGTTTPEPPPSQASSDTKTFIETSMDRETFKTAGLDKLSPAELQVLNSWFLDIMLASKRSAPSQSQEDSTISLPGRKAGSVERALLVKNFNGEKVMVQRNNGDKWMLRAKTWCRWSWRYEGRHVCLVFGQPTSQLINDYGETYDFWTDKKME